MNYIIKAILFKTNNLPFKFCYSLAYSKMLFSKNFSPLVYSKTSTSQDNVD